MVIGAGASSQSRVIRITWRFGTERSGEEKQWLLEYSFISSVIHSLIHLFVSFIFKGTIQQFLAELNEMIGTILTSGDD